VQRQNAHPPMLFVFLFGRIVHRTIRIQPNSLKPLFGTPLIIVIIIIIIIKNEFDLDGTAALVLP